MSPSIHRLVSGAAALALAAGGVLAALPAHASGGVVPTCRNADLTASYRHSDDGAGHSYGAIVLRNTSGHSCRLGGYGGVSYVGDGNGTQIGASAVRTDASALRVFVVAAGQRLRSPLDEVNALNFPKARCHPTQVDGFRVYVPNATASQYVVHPHVGCRNPHVHLMFQKPLQRP